MPQRDDVVTVTERKRNDKTQIQVKFVESTNNLSKKGVICPKNL